jgi:hypothetical protein
MTITDADLERLLTLAAAEYAVPEDGVEAVLAAERLPRPPVVRTPRTWLGTRITPRRLAIGIAVMAVLGVFIGGVVTTGPSKRTSSSSTSSGSRTALDNDLAARTGPESVPASAGFAAASGKYAPAPLPSAPVPAGQGVAVPAPTVATAAALAAAPPRGAPQKVVAGAATAAQAGSAAHAGSSGATSTVAADAGTTDSAKIVRTGQADLTVAKGAVPTARGRLEGLATSFGGYVSSETTTGGDDPSATVTLRVPGDRFATLVAEVQKIGKVDDLSTQAADVTAQYTDLSARIHALEAQRSTYLTLLAKASSIQETLAVQQRVDAVQTQLEQLQGQQKVLDDQTSFGSLAVTVVQEGQANVTTPPKPRTGFAKAWHDAKHRFNGGVQGLVAASGPIAFIAVLALAAWALWLLVRRRWQRARV